MTNPPNSEAIPDWAIEYARASLAIGKQIPAIEKQLNDLGIFHFQQIAELSPTAAHNVGEEVGLPGRVESWIAKAKELTAEEV